MARTPSDATRFTATGPSIASLKSRNTASHVAFPAGPAGETPQQKVARLRELNRRARLVEEPGFERVVARGRVWADRAHKFTTLSLVALTFGAFIMAAFGTTDMILHNRRRRSEFLEEQTLKRERLVAEARQAQMQGSLTQDQVLILNQERANEEAAEARKNKKGILGRMFSGLTKEEAKGGKLGEALLEDSPVTTTTVELQGGADADLKQPLPVVHEATPALRGGPLDQMAYNLQRKTEDTSRGWWSRITGR